MGKKRKNEYVISGSTTNLSDSGCSTQTNASQKKSASVARKKLSVRKNHFSEYFATTRSTLTQLTRKRFMKLNQMKNKPENVKLEKCTRFSSIEEPVDDRKHAMDDQARSINEDAKRQKKSDSLKSHTSMRSESGAGIVCSYYEDGNKENEMEVGSFSAQVEEKVAADQGSIIKLSDANFEIHHQPVFRQHPPPLKPLFFEVPIPSESTYFVPRQWLYKEVDAILSTHINTRGVIVSGSYGTGKTTFSLQLVDYSCFGRKYNDILSSKIPGRPISEDNYKKIVKGESMEVMKLLASNIIAYHFCQVSNRITCMVPEFVHSLAAQMFQVPTMDAYRDFLLANPDRLLALSMEHCVMNPSEAFICGILEPLGILQREEKLSQQSYIIIIDAIGEAENFKGDVGDTIASFVSKHIMRLPSCLKLIITVNKDQHGLISLLPFRQIKLESGRNVVFQDFINYIDYRTQCNKFWTEKEDFVENTEWKNELCQKATGFLHLKLMFDIMESDKKLFEVFPDSLQSTVKLYLENKFAFKNLMDRCVSILSICLASPVPLTSKEIHRSLSFYYSKDNCRWEDIASILHEMHDVLIKRSDGTYMVCHPYFHQWLCDRENADLLHTLNMRRGHSAIVHRYINFECNLGPQKILELGRHVLLADELIGINAESNMVEDLQAKCVQKTSANVSAALVSLENIFFPNFKVSRLLLLAGASPNEVTTCIDESPLLVAYTSLGFLDMVSLLLEFGADPNAANKKGNTALHLACQHGHLELVKLLVNSRALICAVNSQGEVPLVKGAAEGHLSTVLYLLSEKLNEWELVPKDTAVHQAVVAACVNGHMDIVLTLIRLRQEKSLNFSIKQSDSLFGMSPLTAASSAGEQQIVQLLLQHLGDEGWFECDNAPLSAACQNGHEGVVSLLVSAGFSIQEKDRYGETPLIVSAKNGRFDCVKLLVEFNAKVDEVDAHGYTALCWAVLKGNLPLAKYLLETGNANVCHVDSLGRSVLHVAIIADASIDMVELLLSYEADLEAVDSTGIRILDQAVLCENSHLVHLFLKRGAKLSTNTWSLVLGKSDIMIALYQKLLEDGNFLYQQKEYKLAAHRFQYVIKKLPSIDDEEPLEEFFCDLRVACLLKLCRCKRKMREPTEVVNLASDLLKIQPNNLEALCIRAKAFCELGEYDKAMEDMQCAARLDLESLECRRKLHRLKQDILGPMLHHETYELFRPTTPT